MAKGKRKIKLLQSGSSYVEAATSPSLPNLPLTEVLLKYLEYAKSLGRNQTMRAFRA